MKALLIAILCLFSMPAMARDLNPQEEARYNNLGREIRCVVCQSEPIGTSSAKIAIDMRDVVKERIIAGDNDAQIRDFFAKTYGEYVLLRPQINFSTYLLWASPIIILILGFLLIAKLMVNKPQESNEISESELIEAKKIIDDLKS